MHTSYPFFAGSFQSNMVAVAANGAFLARCASQPNEPSTALAALLNIDPDLELCFSNGLDAPLLCHRVILRLSSTVMRDILTGSGGSSKEVSPRSSDSQHPKKPAGQGLLSPEPSASSDSDSSRYTGTLKVDGSRAAWLQILMRCYALHPAAVDDLESLQLMLPVAHKYAFLGIIQRACALVTASLTQLSGRPTGPNSIITWLQLAESLQLDPLKASLIGSIQACSADMWGLIAVDPALENLQVGTLVQLIKISAKPRVPPTVYKCQRGCPMTVPTVTCSSCRQSIGPLLQ